MNPTVVIGQTLHGYDEGHRLLARSGDLDDTTLALLDRMTDLSGYMPPGFEFDRYLTGYPVGRHYVLSATWSDRSAARRGTVFTHSLLLPTESVGQLSLPALVQLHRRPGPSEDHSAWTSALSLDLNGVDAPDPSPLRPPLDAALVLLGSHSERPVLCVDPGPPDAWVARLWGLLWPQARATFAFCTMALGQRRLPHRPFDLLVVPPEARASFTEHARRATWFDGTLGASATLREELNQPWAQQLLEGGGLHVGRLLAWCQDRSLTPPPLSDLRALSRVLALEKDARGRVSSARSKVDLLRRLWPDLPPTHVALREALHDLVEAQRTAPMEPQPLWDIVSLLRRPEVAALSDDDAVFREAVTAVVRTEVSRRITGADGASPESVLDLVGDVEVGPRWGQALFDALVMSIEHGGLDDAYLMELCVAMLQYGRGDALTRVLGRVSAAQRGALVRTFAEGAALHSGGVLLLADSLGALGDVASLFTFLERRVGLDEALRRVTRVAAETGEFGRMEDVLRGLGPAERWRWATECREGMLGDLTARTARQAARELRLPIGDVMRGAEAAPHGEDIVIDRVIESGRYGFANACATMPAFAERLAARVVERLDSLGSSAESILRDAVGALSDERAIGEVIRDRWRLAANRTHAAVVLAVIGPRIVGAVHEARVPLGVVTGWLGEPNVRHWIASVPELSLLAALPGARARGAMLKGVCATSRACLDRIPVQQPMDWVLALVRPSLREASRSDLEGAVDDLAALVEGTGSGRVGKTFAAEVLVALRRDTPPRAWVVIERAFPKIYPPLEGGHDNPFEGTPWISLSWDRARSWRHWLLDVWIDRGWPPASFLRCLNGDATLFWRIAKRAWGGRSRQFIDKLPEALHDDPPLAALWGATLRTIRDGWES